MGVGGEVLAVELKLQAAATSSRGVTEVEVGLGSLESLTLSITVSAVLAWVLWLQNTPLVIKSDEVMAFGEHSKTILLSVS